MSDISSSPQRTVLVLLAGTYRCALPLACAGETMRPLPIRSIPNMPAFVLGISVIRGQPLPVVDLAGLLGESDSATRRFVVVQVEQRKVALAVDEVIGIENLEAMRIAAVPPLLEQARPDQVAALSTADEALLIVLSTARILPEEVWEGIGEEV